MPSYLTILLYRQPDGRLQQQRMQCPSSISVTATVRFARSEAQHFYSYQFQSSQLPVKHCSSTIEVSSNAEGLATVTWRGTYTPYRGKEKVAQDALNGIYIAGLEFIKTRFTKYQQSAARNQL